MIFRSLLFYACKPSARKPSIEWRSRFLHGKPSIEGAVISACTRSQSCQFGASFPFVKPSIEGALVLESRLSRGAVVSCVKSRPSRAQSYPIVKSPVRRTESRRSDTQSPSQGNESRRPGAQSPSLGTPLHEVPVWARNRIVSTAPNHQTVRSRPGRTQQKNVPETQDVQSGHIHNYNKICRADAAAKKYARRLYSSIHVQPIRVKVR